MSRANGTKDRFNALTQNRAVMIWRDLVDVHGFDFAKEFMKSYNELDNARDRISALGMIATYFIPKPTPIEPIAQIDPALINVKIKEDYETLKAIHQERIKRECQASSLSQPLLQESSDQQQAMEPPGLASNQ